MDPNESRKLCALEAIKLIPDHSIIGLGAGRNIEFLIQYLSKKVEKGFVISVATPSTHTKELCITYGIKVVETSSIHELDLSFDGCGEVDESFYASKGGGGIHTKEKLIAAMSKEYILMIDEDKLSSTLSCKYPVCLEILKDSLSYVRKKVAEIGAAAVIRKSNNKDGYTITDDGNLLLDIVFTEVGDWKKLNRYLDNIDGVIGTSLFTKEVTKLIVANENGVRIISRH